MKKGYFQIYTGNGKRKTTAAFGLALRAAGHGLRVYIGQFMKKYPYGEVESLKRFEGIVVEQFGTGNWVDHSVGEEEVEAAERGLEKCREALESGEYDVVVLDEVNVAVYFGLISLDEVLEVVKSKPEGVELVFTGRYAPKELIQLADLVTEMVEVKHYYTKGVLARDGIER